MKIYISGKITGLPFPEVKAKFQAVQDFLEDLDFEVVNPINNGLTKDDTWEQHMVKDIELLLSCDAIYLLDNWIDSTGAGIEYDIAVRTGKDIWFESTGAGIEYDIAVRTGKDIWFGIVRNQRMVLRIQNAIHEVTGMKFNEYTTKSRKRDGFFARMLFAYHCRQGRMKLTNIAKYVHRDHTSILYSLKKYDDEIKYNPAFRELARKVDNILNQKKDI